MAPFLWSKHGQRPFEPSQVDALILSHAHARPGFLTNIVKFFILNFFRHRKKIRLAQSRADGWLPGRGNPGRRLLDGQKKILIYGQSVEVAAEIKSMMVKSARPGHWRPICLKI
jgi:hypothetical protein